MTTETSESELIEPTVAEKREANLYLVETFARKYNLPPKGVVQILSDTAFRLDKEGNAPTPNQVVSLIVVCNAYNLNPFVKEIYAYKDKQDRIIPVVSVDGWLRIINEHPQLAGFRFVYSPERIEEGRAGRPYAPGARVDRMRNHAPRSHRADHRAASTSRSATSRSATTLGLGPWQSHTNRFLRHKALIQCARYAFGFAGIVDPGRSTEHPCGERSRERSARAGRTFDRTAGAEGGDRTG